MKNIKQIAIASVVGLVLAAGVSYAAWRGPSDLPPNDNAPAPINVSANPQTIAAGKELNIASGGGGVGILKINGFVDLDDVLISSAITVKSGTTSPLGPNNEVLYSSITDDYGYFPRVITNAISTDDLVVENLSILKGNVGVGTSSPFRKLSVQGRIHATGDICTGAGGGKCLSSVGGTTSASTPVPAGLYGWCSLTKVRDFEEGICDYRSPASCSATKKQCLCPAGYEKVRTGITDAGLGGVGNVEYYTCYKN